MQRLGRHGPGSAGVDTEARLRRLSLAASEAHQLGMQAMPEGYLLLATGLSKYLSMARNLAASIRVMDGTRRICLVHDENARLEPADARLFDDLAVLTDDPRYPGFMKKIQLFPMSPYCRTMFVDADCLLVKRDINKYWDMARPLPLYHYWKSTHERRMEGG